MKNEGQTSDICAKNIAQTSDDLYTTKYNDANLKNQGNSCTIRQTIYSDQDEIFECSGSLVLAPSESQNHFENPDEPQNKAITPIPSSPHSIAFWAALVIGLTAIGGLISFFIYRSRYNKKTKEKSDIKDTGIFFKVEIINGNYKGKTDSFFLKDELVIGRNPKCDIVFGNKEVSDENSRIFIQSDFIYIEDLGSTNGTALENMKIFAPNRLRSGDIISIGKVQMRFKF